MKESRTKPEVELLEELIRDIHYRLIRVTKRDLLASGISPPRFHLLHYVSVRGPVDMGSAHRHMHVSKSSLTSLVDGLVDESLLARERSELDRRRVVLRVTKEGVSLLNRIRLARCSHLGEALGELSKESVQTMNDSLKTVRRNLEV